MQSEGEHGVRLVMCDEGGLCNPDWLYVRRNSIFRYKLDYGIPTLLALNTESVLYRLLG